MILINCNTAEVIITLVFSIYVIASIYILIRNILVCKFRLSFCKRDKLEEYKQLKDYNSMLFSFKKLKKENFLKKPK